jgi:hemolysin activation/secretion protein
MGNVPFRYLSALGGTDIMRGYYAGRYRDKNLIALQSEFRFPLFWRFGMVVFASIGEVSDKILVYRFKTVKYGIGTGLRFALKPHEKLNLRIDFGWGNQSFASYLTVTEAF